jgi:putative IMPACT (imprinted ancient) family translation regulator
VISTKVDYTWLGKLENELRSSTTFKLKEIKYVEDVEIETYVEENNKQAFIDWMTELTNGQATMTEKEVEYLEKELEFYE